jgi:hypothetical protein
MDNQTLLMKRDAKAKPHLEQYAPVWLIDEKVIPQDDAVQFTVVFRHNLYGWIKRAYRFDGFNNVLYYKGEVLIAEEEALKIQAKDPYITVTVPDIRNAYGG